MNAESKNRDGEQMLEPGFRSAVDPTRIGDEPFELQPRNPFLRLDEHNYLAAELLGTDTGRDALDEAEWLDSEAPDPLQWRNPQLRAMQHDADNAWLDQD